MNALSILLCHGLDVDAVNVDGNTPLHLASRHGMTKAVLYLAGAFPDESLKNNLGFTALDEATSARHAPCADCIQDFTRHGKLNAIQNHYRAERDRLEKLRRDKVQRNITPL